MVLSAPHVAFRSCEMCQKWQYNETTGAIEEKPRGVPLPRITVKGRAMTPCQQGPDICPKGNPELAKERELTMKNYTAYMHYLECRAVGDFPDDPIVRRNAMIIRQVEDAVARKERYELAMV